MTDRDPNIERDMVAYMLWDGLLPGAVARIMGWAYDRVALVRPAPRRNTPAKNARDCARRRAATFAKLKAEWEARRREG